MPERQQAMAEREPRRYRLLQRRFMEREEPAATAVEAVVPLAVQQHTKPPAIGIRSPALL